MDWGEEGRSVRLRKDARSGLGGVVGGNNRHEIETITNVQNDVTRWRGDAETRPAWRKRLCNAYSVSQAAAGEGVAEQGGRRVSVQTTFIPCGLDRYAPGESTMHKVSTVATHLCARRAPGGEADRGPSRAQLP